MVSNPLISVIIPVYNPGVHFEKCMKSILNQTYANLEIILVDDGSTDGSELMCDEYSKMDHRVIVIHQKNQGVSRARNVGMMIAKGDYYHFPDSDDYLEFDTYEYLLTLFKKYDCDAVNFEHYITYKNHEIINNYDEKFYGLFNTRETLDKIASGVQFCWNKLFSKRLIVNVSGNKEIYFDENIARGEDVLFAAAALQNADTVLFDNRALYHYVQSEQSACRGRFKSSQLTLVKLYDAFQPIYGKYPEVWKHFLIFMQGILINLYYDMWGDENDWHKEQKKLARTLHVYYKIVIRIPELSPKMRIKFILFDICPDGFSMLHKLTHRL